MRTAMNTFWGEQSTPRKQDILTPIDIIDRLTNEWGMIALDAAAEATNHVGAEHFYTENGLVAPWRHFTYCNPPYKQLKLWLAKAVEQATLFEDLDPIPIALLCPVRTHRPWYRQALATTSAIVELNALKFFGYANTFPAALHLLFWNWTPHASVWAPHVVTKRTLVQDDCDF